MIDLLFLIVWVINLSFMGISCGLETEKSGENLSGNSLEIEFKDKESRFSNISNRFFWRAITSNHRAIKYNSVFSSIAEDFEIFKIVYDSEKFNIALLCSTLEKHPKLEHKEYFRIIVEVISDFSNRSDLSRKSRRDIVKRIMKNDDSYLLSGSSARNDVSVLRELQNSNNFIEMSDDDLTSVLSVGLFIMINESKIYSDRLKISDGNNILLSLFRIFSYDEELRYVSSIYSQDIDNLMFISEIWEHVKNLRNLSSLESKIEYVETPRDWLRSTMSENIFSIEEKISDMTFNNSVYTQFL